MLAINTHRSCFDFVLEHFGHVDVLVNNAGRSQRANWDEIELTVDRELFELDVFSILNLSRIYVRHIEKYSTGGHLAVTSSAAGLMIVPFSASYCGAKYAINVRCYDFRYLFIARIMIVFHAGIFRKFTYGKTAHWRYDILSRSSVLESVGTMLYQPWRCSVWKNYATEWQTDDGRAMQWIDGHCNCQPNKYELCWPISVAANDLYLELLSEYKENVS